MQIRSSSMLQNSNINQHVEHKGLACHTNRKIIEKPVDIFLSSSKKLL